MEPVCSAGKQHITDIGLHSFAQGLQPAVSSTGQNGNGFVPGNTEETSLSGFLQGVKQSKSYMFTVAIGEANFLWLPVVHCSGLIVKGVYHVMVSTVEPLQRADSQAPFSDQFCSSSYNGYCSD